MKTPWGMAWVRPRVVKMEWRLGPKYIPEINFRQDEYRTEEVLVGPLYDKMRTPVVDMNFYFKGSATAQEIFLMPGINGMSLKIGFGRSQRVNILCEADWAGPDGGFNDYGCFDPYLTNAGMFVNLNINKGLTLGKGTHVVPYGDWSFSAQVAEFVTEDNFMGKIEVVANENLEKLRPEINETIKSLVEAATVKRIHGLKTRCIKAEYVNDNLILDINMNRRCLS